MHLLKLDYQPLSGGSITGLMRAAEIEPNISSKRKTRLHKEQALSAKGFSLTGANRLHD